MYDFEEIHNDFSLLGSFQDRYGIGKSDKAKNTASYKITVVNAQHNIEFKLEVAISGELLIASDEWKDKIKQTCIQKTKDVIDQGDYEKGAPYFCEMTDEEWHIQCQKL